MVDRSTASPQPRSFGRQPAVILLSLVGLGAIAVIVTSVLRPREPVYQGQPLSYWSKQARLPDGDRQTALQAVRAAGPSAAPFLLRELRRQDSTIQRLRRQIWPLLPGPLQKHVTQPPARDDFLFFGTAELLSISGSEAHIFNALRDSNTDVRLAAVWALKRIGAAHRTEGVADRIAPLLSDRAAEVRVSAALTLGAITSNRVEIVPVLIEGLNDSSLRQSVAGNVKFGAPYALARLGPNAQAAIPEMRKLLDHPVAGARVPAAIALWRIAGDTDAVTLLVQELEIAARNKRPEDPWICSTVLSAFAEIGSAAKAATPIIVNLIEFPRRRWPGFYRTNILENARAALRQMDSELERTTKTYWP